MARKGSSLHPNREMAPPCFVSKAKETKVRKKLQGAKIPKGKFQCTWCLKYVTGIHTCHSNAGK